MRQRLRKKSSEMNKTKAVKYIFGVLFLSVSIYSLMNYIDFRNALTKSKPIVYSFIEKRVNKGGRGESYVGSCFK